MSTANQSFLTPSTSQIREALLSMRGDFQQGVEHRPAPPLLLQVATPSDAEYYSILRRRAREVTSMFHEYDAQTAKWSDDYEPGRDAAHKLLGQAQRAKRKLERVSKLLASRYQYASTPGLEYARFATSVELLPS